MEDEPAKRADQPALLGHRDELAWGDCRRLIRPAGERLEAPNLAVRDIDDRLVEDSQGLGLYCLAQVRLQPQAGHDPPVHGRVEDGGLGRSLALRVVHRDVRVAKELARPALRMVDGDADARAHHQLTPLDPEWLAERGLSAARDLLGLLDRLDPVEEDRELVAADPGDRVTGTEACRKPACSRYQELVADGVVEAIVYDLEAIEVEEEDGAPVRLLALRALQGLGQAIQEERAVRKAGERIVQCVVDELLLRGLAGGDVGHRAGYPGRLAILVPDRDTAAENPPVAAVGVPDSMLALEVRGVPLEVAVDLGVDTVDVLGMHPHEPIIGGAVDLAVAAADDCLPARGEVHPPLGQVPVPDSVVRTPHGERIALLVPPELVEHRLVADRVADRPLQHRRVDSILE